MLNLKPKHKKKKTKSNQKQENEKKPKQYKSVCVVLLDMTFLHIIIYICTTFFFLDDKYSNCKIPLLSHVQCDSK